MIATANYGMGIAGGRSHRLYDNLIVSSGQLPDGRAVKAQNVGIYVWNGNKSGIVFEDNQAYNNRVGWNHKDPSQTRNDWWLPQCVESCGNIHFKPEQRISLEEEAAAVQSYLERVKENGIDIGLMKRG